MKGMKLWAGALLMAFVMLFAVACVPETGPEVEEAKLSFLKTDGASVVNEEREKVYLRGVNAGNYGVTEIWMSNFTYSTPPEGQVSSVPKVLDYLTETKVFLERFDYEATKNLWAEYEKAYWSKTDFERCKEMGINVIRLPFTYMNVDFDAIFGLELAGQNYDFTLLDRFVSEAASYGIYTILDMHGAYGSQNGQDHSGEQLSLAQVDFYTNEKKIALTEKLWGAIADHFKDNPNVAGYDILNEPGEKAASTTTRHYVVFDRLYKAIRKTGDQHIVIIESCWGGSNLPAPSKYGWENCMYSFHHYTGCTGMERYQEHRDSFIDRLNEVESQNFNVPLYMGEFTCYGNPDQWEGTLQLLNDRGWHWTSWTFKTCGAGAWGVYNVHLTEEEWVVAHTDSYEDILAKFKLLSSDNEKYVTKCVLVDDEEHGKVTEFDIIKKYAPRTSAQPTMPEANGSQQTE